MTPTETQIPLASRTSFHIGGVARRYYEPRTVADLQEILGRLREPPFILGGGSNTLFPDGDLERPVVSTLRLNRVEIEGETLRAECGVRLGRLIRLAFELGLAGLEGFVGIPGTAGGAVAMNAGGGGWEIGSRVEEVAVVPIGGGPVVRLGGKDVRWGYRGAGLKDLVVAWVTLRLERGSREEMLQRARSIIRRKAATQPLRQWSAGCVFRNPPCGAAGRLIDELGLKGVRRGGARVSERHANFIVNEEGRARAADVKSLVEELQERVAGAFGVRLETEIVLV